MLKLKDIQRFLKQKRTLISVILPTFNRSQKCINVIQSFLDQSYSNFELLIINDGSTEHHSQILENFLSNCLDRRIIYKKQGNMGLSKSLNRGVEMSKGNYITWISDDNGYSRDFLEKLVEKGADFTYSNYYYVQDQKIKHSIYNNYPDVEFLINYFAGMAGFLWSKEVVNNVGGFAECLSGMCEDLDYEIRTFLATDDIIHIDEFLLEFHSSYDTLSAKNAVEISSKHEILKKFYNYYTNLRDRDKFIVYFSDDPVNDFEDESGIKINICNHDTVEFRSDFLIVPVEYQELVYNLLRNSSNREKRKEIYGQVSKSTYFAGLPNCQVFTKDQEKISIVMAYYNRKEQTLRTLDRFQELYQNKYNFEVIIVDDNSREDQNLDELGDNYRFNIKYVKIDAKEKGNNVNPCVVYNKGFQLATGNIIVIQNPECYHVEDILGHVLTNLKDDQYFSYACFTGNSFDLTDELLASDDIPKKIGDPDFSTRNISQLGINWYNHPSERPTGYHFCSAIYKSKLDLIGGFDERFAQGLCFDDDQLLLSIKYNLKLDVKIIDAPFVVHQFHQRNVAFAVDMKDDSDHNKQKWTNNKTLYEKTLQQHEKTKFAFPRLMHLYWDGSPLSYLNYLSALSFSKLNPHWIINVYVPCKRSEKNQWKTGEHSDDYTGRDYFSELRKIPNLFIHSIDIDEIGFDNSAPEVTKSDYFRYWVLYHHGGLWSDFDILYTSPIEEKIKFNNTVLFFCQDSDGYQYYPVGFFLSKPKSKFFKFIVEECQKIKDFSDYQSLGVKLFYDRLIDTSSPSYRKITEVDPDIQICDNKYYLPWQWNEIDQMISVKTNTLPQETVGIHWFNGANRMKRYQNELNERMFQFRNNSFFDSLVGQYIQLDNFSILREDRNRLAENIRFINPKAQESEYFTRTTFSRLDEYNISIVMTSSDRSEQTYFTLETINKQSHKQGVQVVLVDDSSNDPIKAEALARFKNIQIDLIRIKNKKWTNPCVNYNIGFKFVMGKIIVIQNAEVCHVGQTISFFKKIKEEVYYVFDVKNSASFETNKKIYSFGTADVGIYKDLSIFPTDEDLDWYQHHKKHNYMMHFMACMTRKTFENVKEFNYDYSYGTDYDDNDWLLNIVAQKIKIFPVSNEIYRVGGIHLNHSKHNLSSGVNLNNRETYLTKLISFNRNGLFLDYDVAKENIGEIQINYDLEVQETKQFYKLFFKNNQDQRLDRDGKKYDIKLSILIGTVPSRINYFYPRIMNELLRQVGGREDVEIIALFDNKKRTIGKKRQEMIDISQGQYITFIDDDDRIAENYIEEIMRAIYENDDVDCIVYEVLCCIEGGLKKHCKYSVKFEYGDIKEDGTEWRGKPAHTMVWKSEIVKKHQYSDVAHGEDIDWVKRAYHDITQEVSIDKVLYYYDANYSTTSETAGLTDEFIKENVKKLMLTESS